MLDFAAVDAVSPIRVRSPEECAVRISWWDALVSLVLVGVCLFSGLGALGLVGPDEPRYAAIARTMARSGDWVTPRLAGQPWFEKPVLYYWMAAAAFRWFGDGEFSARLPAALAALLAVLVTGWAALRAYGLDAARLTLLILPTSVALIGFARAAAPDMLFSALLAAAAVAAAEMLEKPRAGPIARVAFGALLGAATLAKGPAAVVLAGGAVFLWALASRRWRAALRLAHPVCLAAFVVVAAPWYALCAARNPEFLRVFFLEHNVARYLTSMFRHEQPFWFFAPVLLAAIVPWTALLLPLAGDAFRGRAAGNWRDSPALFFGCWALAPFLFFSFSESKLPSYILPSVPPLLLLVAATSARRLSDETRSSRWWVALVACTLPAMALSARWWLRRLPPDSGLAAPAEWTGILTLVILGGLACVLLALAGRKQASLKAVAILVAVFIVSANASVLPRLDSYLSARAAARTTSAEPGAAEHISVFDLDRPLRYGLEFYLDQPLPDWKPGATLPAWIWTSASGAATLKQQGLPYTLVKKLSPQAWLVRLGAAQTP
jgi:4-amino-4-deoxy-L-arabinose transferase-like glycosyltransferase